jgi:WD40 repeat protein
LFTLHSRDGQISIVFHLAASADLSSIVSHSRETIRLWRPGDDGLVELDGGATTSTSSLSRDGRWAAVAGWGAAAVRVIDMVAQEEAARLDASATIDSSTGIAQVAFSPAGDRIVALVRGGGVIATWAWPSGELLPLRLMDEGDGARSLTLSADGRWIAVAHRDRIDILERESWQPLATLPTHGMLTSRIQFSPDRTRLFAGGMDGTVRIWDLASRRIVGTLYVHPGEVLDIDISADGTTLVTGSSDTTIRVLRAPNASDEVAAARGE